MKRLRDILIMIACCALLYGVGMVHEIWQMEKQNKGIIISWNGFQDRFSIEYHQVQHKDGMANYLDKHGRIVLIRPKTDTAKEKLTKMLK